MVSVVLSMLTCIAVMKYRLPIGITLSILAPVESGLNSVTQPVGLLVLRKSSKDFGRHALTVLHVSSTGFALTKDVRHWGRSFVRQYRACNSCLRQSLGSRMSFGSTMEIHVLAEVCSD
jgi:hypothetical protein